MEEMEYTDMDVRKWEASRVKSTTAVRLTHRIACLPACLPACQIT